MPLKIAVAGIGSLARNNYLPFLRTQKDVELGCWHRTFAAAKEAAQQFGGTAFTFLEDLAAWRPDSVFVLTRETAMIFNYRFFGQTIAERRPIRVAQEFPLL